MIQKVTAVIQLLTISDTKDNSCDTVANKVIQKVTAVIQLLNRSAIQKVTAVIQLLNELQM